MQPAPPRYAPERPFPSYAFLPGRDPHPTRSPEGHSYGAEGEVEPLDPERWGESSDYLYGVDLYNHGYLWEAHEAWEGLWHPAKGDPRLAGHLQGLIQCTAAALKVRMGQPKGLARLAELGTARLLVIAREHPQHLGVDLIDFAAAFRSFAASEPQDAEARPVLELCFD